MPTGILDLDYHYVDGTEHIIERAGFQKMIPHLSAGRTFTMAWDAEVLLKRIPEVIDGIRKKGVRVLPYSAGADPHIDDPLGGMMSTKQMRERDKLVFEHCKAAGMSVA